jgi:hypothetical protein
MIVSKFIVEASFTVVTYDRQNMFIIQATGLSLTTNKRLVCGHAGDKHFILFFPHCQ